MPVHGSGHAVASETGKIVFVNMGPMRDSCGDRPQAFHACLSATDMSDADLSAADRYQGSHVI